MFAASQWESAYHITIKRIHDPTVLATIPSAMQNNLMVCFSIISANIRYEFHMFHMWHDITFYWCLVRGGGY